MKAHDKDTESSVTYHLIQGDIDKFVVHPQTGVIRTLRGLDYEFETKHTIVVGTEEAKVAGALNTPGATCQVEISVEDRNDVTPTFVRTPRGNLLQVRNDVPVGQMLGQVEARDADGSAPFNAVRYELVDEESSDRAGVYFDVDGQTGKIIVNDDLSKELYDQYRVS